MENSFKTIITRSFLAYWGQVCLSSVVTIKLIRSNRGYMSRVARSFCSPLWTKMGVANCPCVTLEMSKVTIRILFEPTGRGHRIVAALALALVLGVVFFESCVLRKVGALASLSDGSWRGSGVYNRCSLWPWLRSGSKSSEFQEVGNSGASGQGQGAPFLPSYEFFPNRFNQSYLTIRLLLVNP